VEATSSRNKPHMNLIRTSRKARQAFTLVELLVVISIIAILAGLALPAISTALVRAQLLQVTSNARQVYIAAQSSALDAAQTSQAGIGWPGDINASSSGAGTAPVGAAGAPTTVAIPTDYIKILVAYDYLNVRDLKILTAPGYTLISTAQPGLSDITETHNAFNMGCVEDSDQSTAIFLFTKNWPTPSGAAGDSVNGSALTTTGKPFGDKGFVVFRKGGDGSSYKKVNAQDTTGMLGTVPSGTPTWLIGSAATGS